MKKIFLSLVALSLAACSSRQAQPDCPIIDILRENTRIYQSDNISDKFQINLSGYDAYCYTNVHNKRRYAVIAPVFKIRRLENSPISSLDVDFYVKTKGHSQDYLGEQVYNQQLHIDNTAREQTVKGKEISIRIAPQPYDGFRLELGLKGSSEQQKKAKKMFDIDYRYFTQEELDAQNDKAIENVYLEVFSDEKVIYSDQDKKPEVVKKNSKTKCGNTCRN